MPNDTCADGYGPLMESIFEAEAANTTMCNNWLEHAVEELLAGLIAMGRNTVYGASTIGHTLAGALVYAGADCRIWRPGTPEPIVILDGVVAGFSGVATAAEHARLTGATEVDALIVAFTGADTVAHVPGIRRLEVINAVAPQLAAA